jgi:hypothetical protein
MKCFIIVFCLSILKNIAYPADHAAEGFAWSEWSLSEVESGKLKVSSDSPQVDRAQWDRWIENVKALKWREKIREISINYCSISSRHLELLCEFKNVEFITLGHSIEGIEIGPESIQHLSKLKKLTVLSVSIHSIDDRYFERFGELQGLEVFAIEAPLRRFISEEGRKSWRPAELSDRALQFLSNIRSLKQARFYYPDPQTPEGTWNFTVQGLSYLRSVPSIEKFRFNDSEFTRVEDTAVFVYSVDSSVGR